MTMKFIDYDKIIYQSFKSIDKDIQGEPPKEVIEETVDIEINPIGELEKEIKKLFNEYVEVIDMFKSAELYLSSIDESTDKTECIIFLNKAKEKLFSGYNKLLIIMRGLDGIAENIN